jgi:hypothetical protein
MTVPNGCPTTFSLPYANSAFVLCNLAGLYQDLGEFSAALACGGNYSDGSRKSFISCRYCRARGHAVLKSDGACMICIFYAGHLNSYEKTQLYEHEFDGYVIWYVISWTLHICPGAAFLISSSTRRGMTVSFA